MTLGGGNAVAEITDLENAMAADTTTLRRRGTPLVVVALVGFAVTVVLTITVLANDDSPPVESAAGEQVPAREFSYFDGSQATLADYRGKPLVINFWATWCPSCVSELSAAFRPAQERLGDSVAFLGFNVQDDRADAVSMVEETGVLFDLADDPDGVLHSEMGGFGMPFTVFVSAGGDIVHKHNGAVTESQLVELIAQHL